mgnify:CR=1 FL=1|jgi:hypothetical protein|tara:strand:- start:18548 stop:18787 length:240 start_codon:yes stop_codon:yes gene_type:complete
MPTYNFKNNLTNEEYSEFMSMAELDLHLKESPHIIQLVSSPNIVSGVSGKKPDDGFRDILRNIKKKHSRGISRSTVNTF